MGDYILLENYIRIARTMMDAMGWSIKKAIKNSPIPIEMQERVTIALEKEELVIIRDPNMVEDQNRNHIKWLSFVDCDDWYYWPRLRQYLIDVKGWPASTVRSIDNSTDIILDAMEDPTNKCEFDTRGLSVGYIQSGKTTHYTVLGAKAADAGYKLIIVLTGMFKSLRYQVQLSLDKELVGLVNGVSAGVGRPLPNYEWCTFTKSDLQYGDFNPGNASTAALNGKNPILLVIKKNGDVLKKLIEWLTKTNENTRRNIPCLIIDDEADQASVNTGGNRCNRPIDWDPGKVFIEESPSIINGLIRQLLNLFSKKSYVAYTATPFANVLIDHTGKDADVGKDLYPRSFIIALPRPNGYYGAEEIFGTVDGTKKGLNIIIDVPESEVRQLVPAKRAEVESFQPIIPNTLRQAILDYVLVGAAMIYRLGDKEPSSMLIHTSYRTTIQQRLAKLVEEQLLKIRYEWFHLRQSSSLRVLLQQRWDREFRTFTRSWNINYDIGFEKLKESISIFLEEVKILQLHSNSSDEVEYEKVSNLKAIIIGGNRLSRGLALQGVLISYFVRLSSKYSYDTLMQMGRWFGFRERYVDLTRIYTTPFLKKMFQELSIVEEELRREIARYEKEKLTPLEVGVKIRQHPAMLITSRLKMRNTNKINISLENKFLQTTTFKFENMLWIKKNLQATCCFLSTLGMPSEGIELGKPIWHDVNSNKIIEYLEHYRTDPQATVVRSELIVKYIKEQNKFEELTHWIVYVVGRKRNDKTLGDIDLNIDGGRRINLIERTKVKDSSSLKAIANIEDQKVGLTDKQLKQAKEMEGVDFYSEALRYVRPRKEGVLLIYPISKYSGFNLDKSNNKNREPIFSKPVKGENIIGIGVIFPHSNTAATREYLIGSVGVGIK